MSFDIINHVQFSISQAEAKCSKLCDDILKYEGMTGTFTRHFYNNVCSMPVPTNPNYLEIGTWYGSSSISAMYKNTINGIFIDNWSQFEGNKSKFIDAAEIYKTSSTYKLIEADCFALSPDKVISNDEKIHVYLYDGGHSYNDHYKAIKHFYSILDKHCIVMIDDWDWDVVRKGTMDAFRDLSAEFLWTKEIILPLSDLQGMPNHSGRYTWWNGIGIFILNKADA